MGKFKVYIEEHYLKIVEVEAENLEDAENKVMLEYIEGDIIVVEDGSIPTRTLMSCEGSEGSTEWHQILGD